jgi:hypothetical protein
LAEGVLRDLEVGAEERSSGELKFLIIIDVVGEIRVVDDGNGSLYSCN